MTRVVRVSEFDFTLPPELLASRSVEPRDQARMFVHDRATRVTRHQRVADLPSTLNAGDLLVLNDTRVRPWRLRGRRASGGGAPAVHIARTPGSSLERHRSRGGGAASGHRDDQARAVEAL